MRVCVVKDKMRYMHGGYCSCCGPPQPQVAGLRRTYMTSSRRRPTTSFCRRCCGRCLVLSWRLRWRHATCRSRPTGGTASASRSQGELG